MNAVNENISDLDLRIYEDEENQNLYSDLF